MKSQARSRTKESSWSRSSNVEFALSWAADLIGHRLRAHREGGSFAAPAELDYLEDGSWLALFLRERRPSWEEFAVFIVALAPHLKTDFLGALIAEHLPEGGEFTQFGGIKGAGYRGILPTGETAQFILAGDDLERRMIVAHLLSGDHWFARQRIL